MTKNAKKSKKGQVQFSANITNKFDLVVIEPKLGFYYLNLYSQCQKAQIYWCYYDEPGAIMRFNQRQIACKNPPHLNVALPSQVDALALRDLVAHLNTSLFLDPQKYFCRRDQSGESFIDGTPEVKQWIYQVEQDIENLPMAQQVLDCRNCNVSDLEQLLEAKGFELTADATKEEVRELAYSLGTKVIADAGIYCGCLPWALLEIQKTLRGVDREKERSQAKALAIMTGHYREATIEDATFLPNVAVNM